jgi:hypothetical protein
MQCAKPHCSKELLYLREGRAELIELELGSRDRESTDDGGFPVKSAPSKLFWLCGDCAKIFIIKRWTPSGLVLVLRLQSMAGTTMASPGSQPSPTGRNSISHPLASSRQRIDA